jgi:predicted dinucleotide-utilizing enzyme
MASAKAASVCQGRLRLLAGAVVRLDAFAAISVPTRTTVPISTDGTDHFGRWTGARPVSSATSR